MAKPTVVAYIDTPEQLLETYWQTISLDSEEAAAMQALAKEILSENE